MCDPDATGGSVTSVPAQRAKVLPTESSRISRNASRHNALDVLARAAISVTENDASDGGGSNRRKLRELVELAPEAITVDRDRRGCLRVGTHGRIIEA